MKPNALLTGISTLAACHLACSEWEAGDQPIEEGAAGAMNQCPEEFNPEQAEPRAARRGFQVVGNRIEDIEGRKVILRGVNRSGSEYQCTKELGFFDGPADEQSIRAMVRWNVNAVRIPLNEACWLSIGDVPETYAGDAYKNAIKTYVDALLQYGITPILDLHWAAPGDLIPTDLYPMPNADHSEAFWQDVAETFLHNDGVIFEPYNEPFPNRNRRDDAAWECWRDGCDEFMGWGSDELYEAVGMQALVDAIRSTGSDHLILLGGVQYSNSLTGWLEYKPDDPIDNLAPAWHIYNFNHCANETCWNEAPLELSEQYPIVATELGQSDCEGSFVVPLIEWLNKRGSGYLAWSWNAFGACVPQSDGNPGAPWSLVTGYSCPVPNSSFANSFYEALQVSAP